MSQITHYEYDGRNADGTLRIIGYYNGSPVMEFAGFPYWNSFTVKIWPRKRKSTAAYGIDVKPKYVGFGQIKGLN